jgi:hypothetical protein
MGPLAGPRGGHSLVSTGRELIVFGGTLGERDRNYRRDGAAYDPAAGAWTPLPPAPDAGRSDHLAVWTGAEMIVLGGHAGRDDVAFNPVTRSWRRIADAPFRIGADASVVQVDAATYVLAPAVERLAVYRSDTDRWTELPLPPLSTRPEVTGDGPVLRRFGTDVVAVAKARTDLAVARLDTPTMRWVQLPGIDLSPPGYRADVVPRLTAVSGNRLLAWTTMGRDGRAAALELNTGTWTEIAAVPVASCEGAQTPLPAADGRVLVFGSCGGGALWDPDTGTWRALDLDGKGDGRTAAWVGNVVHNWGDTCCYGTVSDTFESAAFWRLAL